MRRPGKRGPLSRRPAKQLARNGASRRRAGPWEEYPTRPPAPIPSLFVLSGSVRIADAHGQRFAAATSISAALSEPISHDRDQVFVRDTPKTKVCKRLAR